MKISSQARARIAVALSAFALVLATTVIAEAIVLEADSSYVA